MLSFAFSRSSHDHCLFFRQFGSTFFSLLVYVDDLLITASDEHLTVEVKRFLDSSFSIKDLRPTKYFLGVEISRTTQGLYLTQMKYISDILRDCGMLSARSASTPLPLGSKLVVDSSPLFDDPERYLRLIGCLLYLNFTRPDITHGVHQLSQFVFTPRYPHWDSALHLLKYLKGTSSLGLFYPIGRDFTLQIFSDADWASCLDTRQSLSGYCMFLGSSLTTWKTKKQSIVSRSSAEGEYRSLAMATCEIQWRTYLLQGFSITVSVLVTLWCDNQAAIHIVENPVSMSAPNI